MSNGGAVVTLHDAGLSAKFDNATSAAVAALSQQALMDCNFFCKQDQKTLINSSIIHSDDKAGELHWVTPYAKFQYYLPFANTDKNPNASPQWCEKAYENHGREWQQVLANAIKNGVGQ